MHVRCWFRATIQSGTWSLEGTPKWETTFCSYVRYLTTCVHSVLRWKKSHALHSPLFLLNRNSIFPRTRAPVCCKWNPNCITSKMV
jgi:hypothetical protein